MMLNNRVHLLLGEPMAIRLRWFAMDGRLVYEEHQPNLMEGTYEFSPPFGLPKGYYLLRIEGQDQTYSEPILWIEE
ncbi:MAG: hypothetical protein AAFP19_23490 [Bacteroidota bacterium]